jgi:nucleotide-binding universal stress UspA family protein
MTSDRIDKPDSWIAVGVDGSPGSQAAIRYAVASATRTKSGVRLVHVGPDHLPVVGPYVTPFEALADAGREMLRAASQDAAKQSPSVAIETVHLTGPRTVALVGAANGAGEMVLGHDPSPDMLRMMTGATVLSVAAQAMVPVTAVRPEWTAQHHSRIGVGLKAMELGHDVLRAAFDLADGLDRDLVVQHAWRLSGYESIIATPADKAAITTKANADFHAIARDLQAEYPHIKCDFRVVHGTAATELAALSAECDLLVVGHRRRAFPLGYLGPTGHALLRASECPVRYVPGATNAEADKA